MEFVEFVRRFGRNSGLKDLKIDEDDHVAFTADDIPVHFQYVAQFDVLLVFSELIELPPTADVQLYQSLLEMNYLFMGTQGCTLSKDPDSNKVVLTEKILNFNTMSMEDILELVGRLVSSSEKLIILLKNYRGATKKCNKFKECGEKGDNMFPFTNGIHA